MVTGSAGMGELGSRLSVGQHSLFFLSAPTVLSAVAAPPGRLGAVRGQLMRNRPAILSIDRPAPTFQGCGPQAADQRRRMRACPIARRVSDATQPSTKGSYDMKDDIVIVAAARTPVGAFNGALASLAAHELGKVAIQETLKRADVEGAQVSEVILGQILTAGQGQNPARQASIAAGIPVESPAWGVNQLCGSGLRAVAL